MKIKKRQICMLLLLSIIIVLILQIKADSSPYLISAPVVGKINSETGLPDSFKKYRSLYENFSQEESGKIYLQKEWTKILAKNKFFAPILFYTDKFFSFFDFFWKIVFQIPFSWSWFFILSLAIFIGLIILSYSTLQAFFMELHPFYVFLMAFCIASLVGISTGINEGLSILMKAMPNIWSVLAFFAILSAVVIVYKALMDSGTKKAKKQVEKQRKEIREATEKAHEKITKEKLKAEGLD